MKRYQYKINGRDFDVTVESTDESSAKVTVNGDSFDIDIIHEDMIEPAKAPVDKTAVSTQFKPMEGTSPAGCEVISPLPGIIVGISVSAGQEIRVGQTIAVLEAMKMENEILAEKDGIITAIHVSKGDSVLEGAKIATIG